TVLGPKLQSTVRISSSASVGLGGSPAIYEDITTKSLVGQGQIWHTNVTQSMARPDLAAHRRAMRAPFAKIVAELAEILGKKLTAYVGGVKDTRVIERWIQGDVEEPYRDADRRTRLAYQIAKTLSEHDSAGVV